MRCNTLLYIDRGRIIDNVCNTVAFISSLVLCSVRTAA